MMDYYIKEQDAEKYFVIVDGEDVYEFPTESSEVTEEEKERFFEKVAAAAKLARSEDMIARGLVGGVLTAGDRVYCGGEVVREDMLVSSPLAVDVIEELKEYLPEKDLTSNDNNFIGVYSSYRPPYNNDSISWYEMTEPTQSLLDEYQAPESMRSYLLNWYGLKVDKTSDETMFKVVLDEAYKKIPEGFPVCYYHWAYLLGTDGSISPYYDLYMFCTKEDMQSLCEDLSLDFPCSEEVADSVWCYGVVFDEDNRPIKAKAYERTQVGA